MATQVHAYSGKWEHFGTQESSPIETGLSGLVVTALFFFAMLGPTGLEKIETDH